jgi:hypothetical protein
LNFFITQARPDQEVTDGNGDTPTEVDSEKTSPNKQGQNETIRVTLLPTLLSVLENDSINITTAGYFAKTIIPIIRKRGYEVYN